MSNTRPVPGPSPTLVGTLGLALLLARVLGARYGTFLQQDDLSLAAGVATLMTDNPVEVYRYGPQAGYYRLVQLLSLGDPRDIPWVMTTLSALAATAIPLCGLALFPDRLSVRERWVLAGTLAIHPLLWMSGTYGNSAMPSTALLVGSITLLSHRAGAVGETVALVLCAAAIVVRADAVLATPAVVLLLHQRHGGLRPAVLRAGALAGGLAILYAALFLADPRMHDAVASVASHLTNEEYATRFWEYLLWSTSPLPLAAAALGAGLMLERRRALLGVAVTWCLPFFAFYYSTTTSPRYFLPTAVPLAVCAAVALAKLPGLLAPGHRRIAAWVVGVAASAHLFVALGHFSPGSPRNLLRQGEFETQLGPMWTGALLYKTFAMPHGSAWSSRGRAFGRMNGTLRATDDALGGVATGADAGRTIAVLLGGWNGHAFHFFALAHDARFDAPTRPGSGFAAETWLSLGGARLMAVRRSDAGYRAMPALPAGAGDEVWVFAWDSAADGGMRRRLAPGLVPVPVGDTTAPMRRFLLRRDVR